jgi:1,4-alpha-glucan branching enzyme
VNFKENKSMKLEQFLPAGCSPPKRSPAGQIPATNSTPGTKSKPAAAPGRYSAKGTRHHVDFFCTAPGAKSVSLVGDFNKWDLAATPMRRMPDGRWMASLELHHGHHSYLFIVDGKPRLDPKASGIARNSRNERVSLIAVS